MRYRLLVVDLDGTARSRRLGITPGVRGAVQAAQARGIRVCVATGRMWRSAAPWVERLGVDPPVILYNGGRVFDFVARRVLDDRTVPRAAARRALAVLRADPEVQVHLYVNDGVYVERPHPLTDALVADDGIGCEVVELLDRLLDADPHKLLVIGSPDRLEALDRAIRDSGVRVHTTRSEPHYLEVLPPGVSKGTALATLAGHLGVSLAETVAVGDNWNDLEMLEAAGLGVAMGHAPAGVRARADAVCGPVDEEGLREAILRHVLA